MAVLWKQRVTEVTTTGDLETARGALDDIQGSLLVILRGKHLYNSVRLTGVVRDLRSLADQLEPHIGVIRKEENGAT